MSSSSNNLFPYPYPPSYKTLESPSYRSQDSPLPRRSHSPNFLASVKGFVHRSRSPVRPQTSNEELYHIPPIQESYRAEHHLPVPVSNNESRSMRPSTQRRRKRRENIPSMIDYLTMSQLENVWQKQDTYKGVVDVPQRAPQQGSIISSLRSDEYLETPRMGDHPAYRPYHFCDDLAHSRRAIVSAPTSRRRR